MYSHSKIKTKANDNIYLLTIKKILKKYIVNLFKVEFFIKKIFQNIRICIFEKHTMNFYISKTFMKNILESINQLINTQYIYYIIKYKKIHIFNIFISQRIFIPCYETLTIISMFNAINLNKRICIMDMCSGSGIINMSVLQSYIYLICIDINIFSLFLNTQNLKLNHIRKKFCLINANFFCVVESKHRFCSIILSNPPYIEKNKFILLQHNIKKYEPHHALTLSCKDLFIKWITQKSNNILKLYGYIILETDIFQIFCIFSLNSFFYKSFLLYDKNYIIRGILYKKYEYIQYQIHFKKKNKFILYCKQICNFTKNWKILHRHLSIP